MGGVPPEDLARHQRGEPVVPFKRLKVSEGGLLPLLAAQKASVPTGPDMRRDLLTRTSSNTLASGTATVTGSGLVSSPPLAGVTSPPLAATLGTSAMISGAPIYYPPPDPAVATTGTFPPPPSVNVVPSPHASLPIPMPPSAPSPLLSSPPLSAPGRPISFGIGSPEMPPAAAPLGSPSLVFATITVPPSVDAATGKPLPGAIIVAPDLTMSMVCVDEGYSPGC